MSDTVKSETENKAEAPSPQTPGFRAEQETSSHIPVRPLYTPADLEEWNYAPTEYHVGVLWDEARDRVGERCDGHRTQCHLFDLTET